MTKTVLMPDDIDGFVRFVESKGFLNQRGSERTIEVNFDDMVAFFRKHQEMAAKLAKFEKTEN